HCYGTPPFDGLGALAVRDPAYRGEVHVEEGGDARIAAWSPNRAVIDVEGAPDGALLVYNMNFDDGWRASSDSGAPLAVVPRDNTLSVRVPSGTHRVTFSYRPPNFRLGLAIFAVTALALGALVRRERRILRGTAA